MTFYVIQSSAGGWYCRWYESWARTQSLDDAAWFATLEEAKAWFADVTSRRDDPIIGITYYKVTMEKV